ncbi:MAG: hypothetical protein ACFFAN_05630 [Promethearchaeota archaeon]
MALQLENVKKYITADLVKYGNFVNYINNKLLTKTIGDVCCVDDRNETVAEIVGILLGMKMSHFFPSKSLIAFIKFIKSERLLLRVFINTIKDKFRLGSNWEIIIVPFKEERDSIYLYNMAKNFGDLRFIDYCRSEGIKIIDRNMFSRHYILPVEINSSNQFSQRITKKLLSPINRNDYIESQNLMKDIINTNMQDESIRMTALAQLLFSTIEAYDYYHTIDIVDKINPYYIFEKNFNDDIDRRQLRNFVNNTFIRLMELNNSYNRRLNFLQVALDKYNFENEFKERLQNAIEDLLVVSGFNELIEDLTEWRILFERT